MNDGGDGETVSEDVETGQNETEQSESEKEQCESETEHDSQQQARTDKPPPAKKQRTKGKKKLTTAEVTAAMMKSFVEHHERAEERFMKFEDMRAGEDRAHEECMVRLLLPSLHCITVDKTMMQNFKMILIVAVIIDCCSVAIPIPS